MDLERDERRYRYRFCRAGFGLIALGLALLCLDACGILAWLLTFNPRIRGVVRSDWWDWFVGTPIPWATLIGSYLLWGRSTDPSWQRRAGVLVLLNGADLVSWTIAHNEQLGLGLKDVGHDWLRDQITSGLGWVEFMLFVSLAVEVSRELGKRTEADAGMATQSLATIGLIFWLLSFVTRTDWSTWPLAEKQFAQNQIAVILLIALGMSLLTAITAFHVTAHTIAAYRHCTGALAAMAAEDDAGEELLRSRSETSSDMPEHWFEDTRRWR
jgi:hypothetical protein